MNSWIKAAAVATAVMATPLIAQETLGSGGGAGQARGGGRGMGMMRMADANGDGVVTRDEWMAAADTRFAKMDTNGDGTIEAGERPGRRGPMAAAGGLPPSPEATGRDGPHRPMTREQYRAGAMRRFDRLDTNHDGKIDRTEMAAAATLMRARRVGAGGGGDMTAPPSE